jgi:putative membrane protein
MRLTVAAMLLAALARSAGAHVVAPAAVADPTAPWWSVEPGVVVGLVLTALWYAIGVGARWRTRRTAWFAGGWIALAVALLPPVHPLGSVLFSAHMVQHELLMLVAAPLLVVSRPTGAMLRALPRIGRRLIGRAARWRLVRRAVLALSSAPVAWTLHAAALWVWHWPALFDATLRRESVHALQHATFLATALLFWWTVLHRADRRGVGVLALFTTSIHTSVLGAIITLASRPWYAAYATTTARLGLTRLEDQQLGGLVMWIPGGLVYVAVALWLLGSSLREPVRRAAPAIAATMLVVLMGCGGNADERAAAATGGVPARGRIALRAEGCSTCHTIPGVAGAATVGPSLAGFANRLYVAGVVPNAPDELVRWIRFPHAVDPRTVMPETGVSDAEARDMAAYLYTLR